jgi:hypothetical protein
MIRLLNKTRLAPFSARKISSRSILSCISGSGGRAARRADL